VPTITPSAIRTTPRSSLPPTSRPLSLPSRGGRCIAPKKNMSFRPLPAPLRPCHGPLAHGRAAGASAAGASRHGVGAAQLRRSRPPLPLISLVMQRARGPWPDGASPTCGFTVHSLSPNRDEKRLWKRQLRVRPLAGVGIIISSKRIMGRKYGAGLRRMAEFAADNDSYPEDAEMGLFKRNVPRHYVPIHPDNINSKDWIVLLEAGLSSDVRMRNCALPWQLRKERLSPSTI
jgi:hypothetical protein